MCKLHKLTQIKRITAVSSTLIPEKQRKVPFRGAHSRSIQSFPFRFYQDPLFMPKRVCILAITVCIVVILGIDRKVSLPSSPITTVVGRFVPRRGTSRIVIGEDGNTENALRVHLRSSQQPLQKRFSVVIVTFDEALLNKT